jgi:acetolactate synthase-1/3 small subunit/acetolactate synthase II small subunit
VTERLTINFTPAEGAVLRMLGLIERRGYLVRGISMREEAQGASLMVDVQPRDSGRRVDVMARQLGRLIDVNSVSFAHGDAGSFA